MSPVVEKGATVQTVHFPKGAVWLDYWTGKPYDGGQTTQVPVTIRDIPVFVRAGALTMSEKRLGSTEDYASNSLAIHYYHHPTATAGKGTLYEDDGATFDAFAANAYWQVQFTSTFAEGKPTLRNRSFGFDYTGKPKVRSLQYVIHGLTAPVRNREIASKKRQGARGAGELEARGRQTVSGVRGGRRRRGGCGGVKSSYTLKSSNGYELVLADIYRMLDELNA